jgi:hypothetical protein
MIVQNAKQVALAHEPLKAAILALLPDTGKAAVYTEKMMIDALKKDPAWQDACLSEDRVRRAFEDLVSEGKLIEINKPVGVDPEAPKVG